METTFLVEGQRTQMQNPQPQLSRRSKMETYCDIMKAIGAGAEKPTHVMYKANLSWTVMQGCMKDLETQALVYSLDNDGKRIYKLTEKGFMLLKQYVSIKEDLKLLPDA